MQVYIHIPFCDLKCKYCRFASIWKIQNLHINKYVSFLCKEIKSSKQLQNYLIPELKRRSKIVLDTIYFWWWTPSVLSEQNLKDIFEALKSRFIFSDNIEITLESTPNNITLKNLKIWKNLGINRLSIGIQTLNQKSLEEIWRGTKNPIPGLEKIANYRKKYQSWGWAVSLDFIIWLPYVRKWEILNNIKYVLENYDFIKHISVYMLEEYYNPDKIIETKYDNIIYPENWNKLWLKDEEYLEEYSAIKKFLIEKWFINYEISNFAKPWSLCKHNKWYWEHKEVLAFWMWAYGLVKNFKGERNKNLYIRYANADNFKDYYAGKKIFEEKLNDKDLFLEKVMFQLRTNWLEKEIYKKLEREKINYFIKNWYLKKESEKIILTDSWVLVLDYILKEII